MAAPTNVFVESNSPTIATLNWDYAGTGAIAVFRALHGGAFSEITDPLAGTRIVAGTTTYIDTTLVPGTFYDYKLSDDNGSTFSSIVSVVAQACATSSSLSNASSASAALPQFTSEADVNAQNLQNLSQAVEANLNTQVNNPQDCQVCPTNGSVVIDCSGGCQNITVLATTDINSISINSCFQGNINFNVPPGTTVGICGWPPGWGFGGNECRYAKVAGGTNGRRISVSNPGTGKGGGKSSQGNKPVKAQPWGAGGGACVCVPNGVNKLTIKGCNPGNSLNCASNKSLLVIACGGIPPYSWSKTGSVTLTKLTGPETTVKPPTNTGPNVAGEAYRACCCTCIGSIGQNDIEYRSYGCQDNLLSGCSPAGAATMTCNNGNITNCCGLGTCCNGVGSGFPCTCGKGTNGVVPCTICSGTIPQGSGKLCDVRTAPQIAAGCLPCGVAASSTVTVTDATGTSVTITLLP